MKFAECEIKAIRLACLTSRNPTFVHRYLPHRSLHAIKAQLAKMFPREVKTGPWSEDEIEIFARLIMEGKNTSYLCKVLRRSAPDVEEKADDLGLTIGRQTTESTSKKNEKAFADCIQGKILSVDLIADEIDKRGPVSPMAAPLERAAASIAHWRDLRDAGHFHGFTEMNIPPDGLAPRVVSPSKEVLSYCSSSAEW